MARLINQKEVQELSSLEFFAQQVVEGFITGLHKSPYHGFSVEFSEHRLYNSGESIKNIDWKVYARTEKLFVKRFEEETNLRCQIVIDNSSSMHYPRENDGDKNKLHFSIHAAASLIYLLRKQRDAIGLTTFSDKIEQHFPAKSSGVQHKLIFHELEKLLEKNSSELNKETKAAETLHHIADSIHKRSLVIIFSDMLEDNSEQLFSALQHLKHNKHEVILFHVADKQKELEFDFENRPYKFVDMETQEEVKVHPNQIKETYLKSISEYKNQLILKCGQYKIDFVEADIHEGYKQILLPYLIKRKKLY